MLNSLLLHGIFFKPCNSFLLFLTQVFSVFSMYFCLKKIKTYYYYYYYYYYYLLLHFSIGKWCNIVQNSVKSTKFGRGIGMNTLINTG